MQEILPYVCVDFVGAQIINRYAISLRQSPHMSPTTRFRVLLLSPRIPLRSRIWKTGRDVCADRRIVRCAQSAFPERAD